MAGGYETLQAMLQGRPIVFHPMLARAFGGISEALLFQQLAYWSNKGHDPDWIYKTQKDLEAETCLTRTQQETARRSLRTLGVIEEKKQGLPAKLYFRVIWPVVFAVLDEFSSDSSKVAGNLQPRMRNTDEPVRRKPANQIAANQQPLTRKTEKTSKMSTEMSTNRHVEEPISNHGVVVVSDEGLDGTTELDLTQVLAQIAQKLHDESDLNRSFGRLANLYTAANLDLKAFVDRTNLAVARTLRADVTERTEKGQPARMRYFFKVLQDVLGLRTDDEPRSGTASLPVGDEPYVLPVDRGTGSRVMHRIPRTQAPRRPGRTG